MYIHSYINIYMQISYIHILYNMVIVGTTMVVILVELSIFREGDEKTVYVEKME